MRFLLFLFLFLTAEKCYSQVQLKLVFIDSCSNKVMKQDFSLLDGNGSRLRSIYSENGIANLKDTGYYLLSAERDDLIGFQVTQYSLNIDTVFIRKLKFNVYIGHSNYTFCDSLANGKLVDFHENGQCRIRGTFKNGQPVDTIIQFYKNGFKKEYYLPQKRLIRYYPSGKVKSDYNTKEQIEFEYYENGQLKKYRSSKRKNYRLNEYYENGNLKSVKLRWRMLRYDSIGNRTDKIRFKEKTFRSLYKESQRKKILNHEYKWLKYDSEGNKYKLISFTDYMAYPGSFDSDLTDLKKYSIEEVVFYRNNKPNKKLEVKYAVKRGDLTKELLIYIRKDGKWVLEKVEEDESKVFDYIK